MTDVVTMKSQRWAQKGVSFEEVLQGRLVLVPEGERLNQIAADHKTAIEGTVMSQCGTWLVLRLSNHSGQQHVARFLPDRLSGMVKALPNLAQQEAVFVGEGASLPARIRIRDLPEHQLPKSETIKFIRGWITPGPSSDDVLNVAQRMTS
jgi:hypothetical protein